MTTLGHISANLREACAIQNSDDYQRSHGFFIGAGVRLSPAYDMNSSFDRTQSSLAINEVDTTCDFAIAINAYEDYGLEMEQAEKVREPLYAAVAAGREEVDLLHIPRTEQDPMETVFAHWAAEDMRGFGVEQMPTLSKAYRPA